jgi:hypothetical protein
MLIDEITRFSLRKYDEWLVERRRDYEESEDKEDYIYGLFLSTYQSPAALPWRVIESFLGKIRFSDLIGKDDEEIGEIVRGAARMTRGFNPQGGFKIFAEFHRELVRRARDSGGLLSYVKRFRDSESLYNDLLSLPGVGPVIGLQLVRELKMSGAIDLDISGLPIPPADPVRRVVERTGLVDRGASWEVINDVLRRSFKIPPLVLDAGLWHIGFYYCKRKPECDVCPIAHLCPKQIEGGSNG